MMKIIANRQQLLQVFNDVSGFIPGKSPRQILQNSLLTCSVDGSTLQGTDTELGIRCGVIGIDVQAPGSVVLPHGKVASILESSDDESIAIERTNSAVILSGMSAEFRLQIEDPDQYPEVPSFTAKGFRTVKGSDLIRIINRTMFAADVKSTRYMLGGCHVVFADESVLFEATDGKCIARMVCPSGSIGKYENVTNHTIVPVKALTKVVRAIDPESEVHVFVDASSVMVRSGMTTIIGRLLEGRFPPVSTVLDVETPTVIQLDLQRFRKAVNQASIVTSIESQRIDFRFGDNKVKMSSSAADVGSSRVEIPVDYDGDAIDIAFSSEYLSDALKHIDNDVSLSIGLTDEGRFATFRTSDNCIYSIATIAG